MALGTTQKAKLAQAVAQSVTKEFALLKTNWLAKRWLKLGNRYHKDTINRIKEDADTGGTIRHSHLREYVSASSITHCMDGWSYLGHAISAHLHGDSDTSRHLGYYAELRAGMALLATEGIGVFGRTHCVVTKNGRCQGFRSDGTHEFVWNALEYWAELPSAQTRILEAIEPGGVPLDQWLQRFSVGAGFRSIIAKKWLSEWGLDLMRLAKDRDARNIASYRPTAVHSTRAVPIDDALKYVNDMWGLFEPTNEMRFRLLDRYLLQSSMGLVFKSTYGSLRSARQAKRQFSRQVKVMLHEFSPYDMTSDQWERFLVDNLALELPSLFQHASGKLQPSDPGHHKEVIARALLLLRLASGACRTLLKSSSTSASEIAFWWAPLGQDRGLWNAGTEPTNFVDLWANIRDALTDVIAWQRTNGGSASYKKLWDEQAIAASALGGGVQAGLWGIGL